MRSLVWRINTVCYCFNPKNLFLLIDNCWQVESSSDKHSYDAPGFSCNKNLVLKTIFYQYKLEKNNQSHGHGLSTNCAYNSNVENYNWKGMHVHGTVDGCTAVCQ